MYNPCVKPCEKGTFLCLAAWSLSCLFSQGCPWLLYDLWSCGYCWDLSSYCLLHYLGNHILTWVGPKPCLEGPREDGNAGCMGLRKLPPKWSFWEDFFHSYREQWFLLPANGVLKVMSAVTSAILGDVKKTHPTTKNKQTNKSNFCAFSALLLPTWAVAKVQSKIRKKPTSQKTFSQMHTGGKIPYFQVPADELLKPYPMQI